MRKHSDIIWVTLLLALVPLFVGDSAYYMRVATIALIYMSWTVAFNLIFGHTKQLFLCLNTLAGAAAYVAIVLTKQFGVSPWISVSIGVATAGALGALFSYVSVVRGLGVIFLGIITLAFTLIFHNVLLGLRELTNGETGLVSKGLGIPLLEDARAAYYIFFGLLLVATVVYCMLMDSRMGVAVRALSDDELTAQLSGVNVTGYKVLFAAIGSGLLGLTGAFYGFYNEIISPSIFSFVNVDIPVLIALLLGGIRTRIGPIIGAAVFAAIDELVRPFGQLNMLVYGALLIVLFLAFRDGLVPMLHKAFRASPLYGRPAGHAIGSARVRQ